MKREDIQPVIERYYQDETVGNDGDIEKVDNYIVSLENKIEELKNVIGGVYTGYYCAEHGAINGVEVTFYEKCAICGRDANHVPDSKGD